MSGATVYIEEDKPIIFKKDGSWLHGQTPIINERVINYFLSLMRKEGEDYYLVSDTEKVPLHVEDTPYVVIRVVFYEVDEKLEAELLLNDRSRHILDLNTFTIREDREWQVEVDHRIGHVPVLFTQQAKIDLISEADPDGESEEEDMPYAVLHVNGGKVHLPLQ